MLSNTQASVAGTVTGRFGWLRADLLASVLIARLVTGVHDLYVWTITGGFDPLSLHTCVAARSADAVLDDLRVVLREHSALDHATIQVEPGAACVPACRATGET